MGQWMNEASMVGTSPLAHAFLLKEVFYSPFSSVHAWVTGFWIMSLRRFLTPSHYVTKYPSIVHVMRVLPFLIQWPSINKKWSIYFIIDHWWHWVNWFIHKWYHTNEWPHVFVNRNFHAHLHRHVEACCNQFMLNVPRTLIQAIKVYELTQN